MSPPSEDRRALEHRFSLVFVHLGFITAYIRRRGGHDPEALAAEVMTIAWRRLADVPGGDPRPWLIATARNLVLADWRGRGREQRALKGSSTPATVPAIATPGLDASLQAALLALSDQDREALLLIAWEDLTPAVAAESLGISSMAFRARLYRVRRHLASALAAEPAEPPFHPTPRSSNG
jgi:RNA polymerase sigma-70 factor (ECF subfamily)